MKWRTKWVWACMLTLTVIGVAQLEIAGVIEKPVTQYVTTGDDFLVMKKWVATIIKDPNEETIMVTANKDIVALAAYESMQPYRDGVLVSYSTPLAIHARGNGLIIFTGFTRRTGKTVTVLYDEGDEVTYGFVGTFSKLPYTTVKKGDVLALMNDDSAMFLKVRQNGVRLDSSLLPAYLSGTSE
ncbi:hypothetical protein ACFSFY_04400 [Sporosarcina siberiensis]|uniref:Peptidase family M23 n=1 Tax=Sporosarcina siberiensis TaxID=1365606 RepID=A0ABW4SD82_9BACL